MDFHGHINLRENEMRKMAFDQETDFPASPVVGRMVFKGFVLYMCVDLNGILPIWIPITNTINTYTHTQSAAATTWTVVHSLNSSTPTVQIYDNNGSLIIPESVTSSDALTTVITLNTAIAGTAVVMIGDLIPTDGVGVLAPDRVALTENVSGSTTYVIKHNLGYYPLVRVFVNDNEVQPADVIHDSIFQTTVTFSVIVTATIRFT